MADIQTIARNKWVAQFNGRNLDATTKKVPGKYGKPVDELIIIDKVTGQHIVGEERDSFKALLDYHVKQKQPRTHIPTVRTMQESGRIYDH